MKIFIKLFQFSQIFPPWEESGNQTIGASSRTGPCGPRRKSNAVVLHRNGTGNVFVQASLVNLFIPEGMLEPIPAAINWKAAVHLGRVSGLDCG